MNKLLGLNIELHVDRYGKLRVSTKADLGNIYVVVGFKIKAYKEKNYVLPLLRVEIPKK